MAKNYTEGLAAPQLAAVEEYRRRLAEEFPDIEILEVRAVDGAVDIRLNERLCHHKSYHRTCYRSRR
jgi:hypothetical protein